MMDTILVAVFEYFLIIIGKVIIPIVGSLVMRIRLTIFDNTLIRPCQIHQEMNFVRASVGHTNLPKLNYFTTHRDHDNIRVWELYPVYLYPQK